MSADNYALIGIHPSAGKWTFPSTLHGVHVGFMSNDNQPSAIPEGSKAFNTHEEAVAHADQLETEYGVRFLCDCHRKTEKAPTPKRTVRQVIEEFRRSAAVRTGMHVRVTESLEWQSSIKL